MFTIFSSCAILLFDNILYFTLALTTMASRVQWISLFYRSCFSVFLFLFLFSGLDLCAIAILPEQPVLNLSWSKFHWWSSICCLVFFLSPTICQTQNILSDLPKLCLTKLRCGQGVSIVHICGKSIQSDDTTAIDAIFGNLFNWETNQSFMLVSIFRNQKIDLAYAWILCYQLFCLFSLDNPISGCP